MMTISPGFALTILGPVLLAGLAFGESVPSGTILQVRLLTELSSRKSKVADPVRAVLLADVPSDHQPLLPAGLELSGTVREVVQKRNHPARLRIEFDTIRRPGGPALPFSGRLREVDNARETIAPDGTIVGLRPVQVRPSKKEDVLMVAMYAHPLLLASFEGARLLRREMEDPAIHYPKPVSMAIEVTTELDTRTLTGSIPLARGRAVAASEYADLAAAQPLRTESGGKLSDQTNLLFAGTAEELDSAFSRAGWTRADGRGVRSDLHTILALLNHHEYSAAPVSLLTLEGKPPDCVYEKQTNTFSKRHHIRLWKRPGELEGKPVWLAAATHDIGIVFSKEARHYSHQVEANVDWERTIILDALRFEGVVERFSLVPRATAEHAFQNATGDHLVSDGRLAVVVLRKPLTSPPH